MSHFSRYYGGSKLLFVQCCVVFTAWMKYVFQINVIVIFSDVWSLGCVLYEMLTLKHAVRTNPVSP